MTPEQIQRLRELETRATTEGPLSVESDYTPIESNDPSSPSGYWEVTIWRPGEEDFVLAGQAVDSNPVADVEVMVEARNALPNLLDDWERMRRLVEAALPYLPAATATQEEFCATVGHPTDPSDGRGRCYCTHYKPTRTLDDGFGNVWAKCDRADCGLQIVRPGKAQCPRCEDEEASRD